MNRQIDFVAGVKKKKCFSLYAQHFKKLMIEREIRHFIVEYRQKKRRLKVDFVFQ